MSAELVPVRFSGDGGWRGGCLVIHALICCESLPDDTMDCINAYLNALSTLLSDQDGTPVFDSLSKGDKEMCRITRTGLSKWMDELLLKAGIVKKGRACHALRHTCGALLYQATRDVKVVQETLRHVSIGMAAKYSHVEDRGKARYTKAIPVDP